jgi:hypothetical protein
LHTNSVLEPSASSNHIQKTYDGWNGKRSMQWRIDESQPPVWEHTNSIMSAWKLGIREGTRNLTMRIPSLQVNVIKESLAVFDSKGYCNCIVLCVCWRTCRTRDHIL